MSALPDSIALVYHPLTESLLRDVGVAFRPPVHTTTSGGAGDAPWIHVDSGEALAKPAAVAGVLRALMAVGLERADLPANIMYLTELDRLANLLGAGDGHRHS